MNIDRNNETEKEIAYPKESKMTREQIRVKERIEAEANRVYQQLAEKFLSFMVECEDPEGPEVEEKKKQISAQWRLYCTRKQLLPVAYPVIDE